MVFFVSSIALTPVNDKRRRTRMNRERARCGEKRLVEAGAQGWRLALPLQRWAFRIAPLTSASREELGLPRSAARTARSAVVLL